MSRDTDTNIVCTCASRHLQVTLYALKEAEHMDILQRDDVIELIKRIAMTADG